MLEATFKAAKTIAEIKNFQLSNLELQKLLYLCHMFYLGITNDPLIDGEFQAWNYGPVQPEIYHMFKAYGGKNIKDIFPVDSFSKDSKEFAVIDRVLSSVKDKTPGQLINITHRPYGAWAKNFHVEMKDVIIPNDDIKNEFIFRMKAINQ